MPQLEAMVFQYKTVEPMHSRASAASTISSFLAYKSQVIEQRETGGISKPASSYRFSCANLEKNSPYSSQAAASNKTKLPSKQPVEQRQVFQPNDCETIPERSPQPVSEQAFESSSSSLLEKLLAATAATTRANASCRYNQSK